MRQAGLSQVRWFGLSGGMVTIHRATRVDGDADVPRMALDGARDRAHGGAFSPREREMLPVEKRR